MAFRKQLIELLSTEFRSASSLARELGMTRGDVQDDLRHALRSARAAGSVSTMSPAIIAISPREAAVRSPARPWR
jgi:hypothetical protein